MDLKKIHASLIYGSAKILSTKNFSIWKIIPIERLLTLVRIEVIQNLKMTVFQHWICVLSSRQQNHRHRRRRQRVQWLVALHVEESTKIFQELAGKWAMTLKWPKLDLLLLPIIQEVWLYMIQKLNAQDNFYGVTLKILCTHALLHGIFDGEANVDFKLWAFYNFHASKLIRAQVWNGKLKIPTDLEKPTI